VKTPRERYENDNHYRALVDTMEVHIHAAQFTPSEMREAALLASIHYEMTHVKSYLVPPRVEEAMGVLMGWREQHDPDSLDPTGE